MSLQFIHDNKGNTTGVFIPIDDWQTLKAKYADLQNEEATAEAGLSNWQKQIIDTRLSDYYKNPSAVNDFDKTIDDLERNL